MIVKNMRYVRRKEFGEPATLHLQMLVLHDFDPVHQETEEWIDVPTVIEEK